MIIALDVYANRPVCVCTENTTPPKKSQDPNSNSGAMNGRGPQVYCTEQEAENRYVQETRTTEQRTRRMGHAIKHPEKWASHHVHRWVILRTHSHVIASRTRRHTDDSTKVLARSKDFSFHLPHLEESIVPGKDQHDLFKRNIRVRNHTGQTAVAPPRLAPYSSAPRLLPSQTLLRGVPSPAASRVAPVARSE